MSKMLTVTEVARALGLKPATIRSWIWKRQIRYVKVSRAVRIPADEVERLIESGTRPAVTLIATKESMRKDRE
jgi:excisionase family DNA binding protein